MTQHSATKSYPCGVCLCSVSRTSKNPSGFHDFVPWAAKCWKGRYDNTAGVRHDPHKLCHPIQPHHLYPSQSIHVVLPQYGFQLQHLFFCEKSGPSAYSRINYQAKAFMLLDSIKKSDLPEANQADHPHPFIVWGWLEHGKKFQSSSCPAVQWRITWITHIVNWEQVYKAQQEDDSTFMIQDFFQTNAAVSKHLNSCKLTPSMDWVNDWILCTLDSQDQTEAYEFTHNIPAWRNC